MVLAFLGLVHFFHSAALVLFLLSLHVPVSAVSPLSDDLSSGDCFRSEKFKGIYYIWSLKYRDSLRSKELLFFHTRRSLSD